MSKRTADLRIVDAISRRPESNLRIVTFRPTANPETWRRYINPSQPSLARLWAILTAYGFQIDEPESIMETTETTIKARNPWTAFVYR